MVILMYFYYFWYLIFLPSFACLSLPLCCTFCLSLAVKGIKRQHLVEIRALPNPPALVKVAIESICIMLGEQDLEWKSLRSIIMKENFISFIINFKTEDIT